MPRRVPVSHPDEDSTFLCPPALCLHRSRGSRFYMLIADGLRMRVGCEGDGWQGRRRVKGREGAAWEHFSSAKPWATLAVQLEVRPGKRARGGDRWR